MRSWFSLIVLSFSVAIVSCGSNAELNFSGNDEPDAGADASVEGGTPTGPGALDDGGGGGCTPLSCADQGIGCGPAGDGCGGVIECGSCQAPETCGGGGEYSQCGGSSGCVPRTCDDIDPETCGPVADGCGGLLECGGCTAPDICGGAGVPSRCGHTSACVPKTCADIEAAGLCGPQSDGCGGILDTCATLSCALPELCGGDPSKPGQCGVPPMPGDGGPVGECTPRSCDDIGAKTCGPQSDGCGGLIECASSCATGEICGGDSAQPGQCAAPPSACTPKASCDPGECGPVADGCGGVLSCSGCAAGEQCGGVGKPSQCVPIPTCTPRSCAQLGLNCGPAGDGCGGLIAGGCGTCPTGQFCGGSGPGRCGVGLDPGGAGDYPECTGTATTTISGRAVFGNFGEMLPLNGAEVYIPAGGLPAISDGVSCVQCSAPENVLAAATTGPDGTFELFNTPAGPDVPIVVQMGKWRRMVTVNVNPCVNNELDEDDTRLPRNSSEGHIPKMAIATGSIDAIECVLRKMGIDDDEFAIPSRNKRISIYQDTGALSRTGETTPKATDLWDSATELDKYDVILHPCNGGSHTVNRNRLNRIVDYTTKGGRLFATHWSQSWLYDTYSSGKGDVSAWGCGNDCKTSGKTVAHWKTSSSNWPDDPFTATVDNSPGKRAAFAQWLANVGAISGGPLQVSLRETRHHVDSLVGSNAQRWIYGTNSKRTASSTVQHFTFNTPVNKPEAERCGRVVYSDFHVTLASSKDKPFPTQCENLPLTAQEKILAFMLLDLTSCIRPDEPPTCQPKTCAELGAECGQQGDGCGGLIPCGECTAPATCGGGGVPNQCSDRGPCQKLSCEDQGIECGPAGDGCGGGHASCGTCTFPDTCGGGGVPGQCGHLACEPRSCEAQGIECGPAGDGCGGKHESCGTCTWPETCGGGGVPGKCGMSDGGFCEPKTCGDLGLGCGPAGDGCGGLLDCGSCEAPDICGGAGVPGECGHIACEPTSCEELGLGCGPAGDGCGGTLDCGNCEAPESCGGGGVPGQCGKPDCTPRTCKQAGISCGPMGDGCGGVVECGTCQPPQSCGGGGKPGVCGGGIR